MANPNEWHSADFSKLLPEEFSDVVSTINSTITPVVAVLEPVSDVLGVIEEILSYTADTWTEVISDLIDEIKALIFGAGFYYLPMWDHGLTQFKTMVNNIDTAVGEELTIASLTSASTLSTAITMDEFLSKMNVTFDDSGDDDRPGFGGDIGVLSNVRAFVILVGASGFSDFFALFRVMLSLWPTNRELQRIADALEVIEDSATDQLEPTSSRSPDWENATSEDLINYLVPSLAEGMDVAIEYILKILATEATLIEALSETVSLIKRKIDVLQSIGTQVQTIITNIESILSATGLQVVYLKSSTGVPGIKQALLAATNRPYTTEKVFISGGMFLGGPESAALFDTIFGEV